ncbi:MAG: hypothetical protein ACLFT3_18015 [Cyclobacteriaceae bacterium]
MIISCNGPDDPSPDGNFPDDGNTNPTSFLNVDPAVTYQTISGFGGADGIFNGIDLTDDEAQLAFGTEEGHLGLSIFRVKLPYEPADWNRISENARQAQQFGVKILASPWSPPPSLKSNSDPVGGFLPESSFAAYADHLNDFINYMSGAGVDIHAITIQNEPDIEVSYESCDWTPSSMIAFIKAYGGDNIRTRIGAPESFQFNQNFTNALLRDEEASAKFDIVAGHIYGGGLMPYPLAEEQGKEIWMTEHLYNLGTGNAGATPWSARSDEDKWDETMQMLSDIHTSMNLNWHAYIWWYTKRYYSFIGDGTQNTSTNTILKRGYAFSHYARFVRPGFTRVGTEFTSVRELAITAYQGDEQTVIVIVNEGPTSVSNVGLSIADQVPASATVYRTSLDQDVEQSEIQSENENLLFSVGPRSVTTIVIEQ